MVVWWWFCRGRKEQITLIHTMHAWYLYLQLVDFCGKRRYKYTIVPWILWVNKIKIHGPRQQIFLEVEVVPLFWRLNHIRLITTVLESWEVLCCCRKVSSDRRKFFYVVGTAACIPKTRLPFQDKTLIGCVVWVVLSYTLGIQSPKLRMVLEPKYFAEEVIRHPNHPLTRWLDP